jgi:hypothetical protein
LENYKANDVILHKQIQIVINYIDDINRILNIQYTPKFSADLQKSKKKTENNNKIHISIYEEMLSLPPDLSGNIIHSHSKSANYNSI